MLLLDESLDLLLAPTLLARALLAKVVIPALSPACGAGRRHLPMTLVTPGRCAGRGLQSATGVVAVPADAAAALFVSWSAEPLELEFGASEEREYRPEGQRDDVGDESEHGLRLGSLHARGHHRRVPTRVGRDAQPKRDVARTRTRVWRSSGRVAGLQGGAAAGEYREPDFQGAWIPLTERTSGGLLGKLAGRVKESAGSVTGNEELAREGRLQRAQSEAELEANRRAQEARQRQDQAELERERTETELERERLQNEVAEQERGLRAERDREEAERRAQAEEQQAKAQAERERAVRESAAEAAAQRAESERLEAAKQEIRLEQEARRAEAEADAVDPEGDR